MATDKDSTHQGYDSGKSSDKWLSPSKPYTGDGKTKREPYDKPRVENKKGN